MPSFASDKKIIFLGMGGARYTVFNQLMPSGGVLIIYDGLRIVLDPGPDVLVRLREVGFYPSQIDGVLLSHVHLDHSAGVNPLLEAVIEGGKRKKGFIFAPVEALVGSSSILLNYIRESLEVIQPLFPGKEYSIGSFRFTVYPHFHSAETYGFKFDFPDRKVAFVIDTEYRDDLVEYYSDASVLILNVVLWEPRPGVRHLSLEGASMLIEKVKPDLAILTHFGMKFLHGRTREAARIVKERTGVEVLSAYYGACLDLSGESLRFYKYFPSKRKS